MKGSPVIPMGHVQIGLWLLTRQCARNPHVFGQGSSHFWLIQALEISHSLFTTHWGLHLGGDPI